MGTLSLVQGILAVVAFLVLVFVIAMTLKYFLNFSDEEAYINKVKPH